MEINMLSLASSADFSYVNTGDLLADAIEIIDSAQKFAHGAVNYSLVMRNWLLGKRITEEELHGGKAEYGAQVIKQLSKDLKQTYGPAICGGWRSQMR